MVDRVLVPLDGSSLAERALDALAAIPCRRALLLRVTPADAPATPAADDYLARIAGVLADRGVAAEMRAVAGDPAERIVAAAIDVDLIAMTSRGRGAGGQRLFGSVADRVARHAPKPTLIFRAGDDVAPPAPNGRIVVPLDGSPVADRAVHLARALCRAPGRPLHLVGVAAEPGGALAAHLDAVAGELRAAGITAAVEVRHGEPEVEIVAATRPGDLVVMTTHGASGGQRWRIGHVAERMLRRGPAPVVLVRGDRAATVSLDSGRIDA
jgi:nucleotide-binding universal stress UspA family protein